MTTTREFLREYRKADEITQIDIQRFADKPQGHKRSMAVILPNDPFFPFLADNPQYDGAALADALVRKEKV